MNITQKIITFSLIGSKYKLFFHLEKVLLSLPTKYFVSMVELAVSMVSQIGFLLKAIRGSGTLIVSEYVLT